MKIHLEYISACALLLSMISCKDTLDTNPSSSFTEEVVWNSYSTADAFVNGTYVAVLTGTGLAGSGNCVSWEARTPNGLQFSQVGGEGIDGIATELGVTNATDFGANRFSLLRRCNKIITNATNSNLKDSEKAKLIAEGRFLRGLTFFDQTRKMGRFIPLTTVLSISDSAACRTPLTANVDESYKYVIDDLSAAVNGLPVSAPSGRASKYAAEVFLSRACLQAYAYTKKEEYLDKAITSAKDVIQNSGISLTSNYGGMFNESDPTNPEILLGYYRVKENSRVENFAELIRVYPNVRLDDMKNSKCYQTYTTGVMLFQAWGMYFPTQDMVDQYLVTDENTGKALPWYETSQFKDNAEEVDVNTVTHAGQVDMYARKDGSRRRIPTPQDLKETKTGYPIFQRYVRCKPSATRNLTDIMYSKRDKRFAATIVYDSCAAWLGFPVTLNLGGNLSQGVREMEDGGWYNTATGYYWRKNTLEKLEPRAFYNVKVDFHYVLARVGEAYMNLAEAELLKGNVSAAVEALNHTRTIHGGLAPSTASTEEQAWQDYIRERRCEMACEGEDIYFSYLRWGKYGGYANYGRTPGDVVYDLDRPVYKIEISRDRRKVLIGQVTVAGSANRNFTQKRYLLPIQQGFLNTREAYGLDHEQNQGW